MVPEYYMFLRPYINGLKQYGHLMKICPLGVFLFFNLKQKTGKIDYTAVFN